MYRKAASCINVQCFCKKQTLIVSAISLTSSTMSSDRLSKLARGESLGALTVREVEVAAELLHRAVIHEQGNAIVEKVAKQIHGRTAAVHVQTLCKDVQGMTDAAKRRRDADELESWDNVSHVSYGSELDPASCIPKPFNVYPSSSGVNVPIEESGGSSGDARAMADGTPFPPEVSNVKEWGRTIITMKKYADLNVTYEEFLKLASNDGEMMRYASWIQKTYTPAKDEMSTVKITAAVDFALFMKKIGWKPASQQDFVRKMK